MTGNFFNYSQYYDLLYKDKDYAGEVAYLRELFKRYGNRVNEILELGCGTGRHAELLSNHGYHVMGVEQSGTMLEHSVARAASVRNSPSAGTFEPRAGDARTFSVDRKFDAVISLFHVVSYQTTNSDVSQIFSTAAKHIKRGGLFIFDVWYGPAVLSIGPAVRVKRMENEQIEVLRIAEPKLFANDNRVEIEYSIIVTNKKSQEVTQLSEIHHMRYFFAPELALFAECHGLTVLQSEEWMTSQAPGTDTWGVTFILRSPDMKSAGH